jgi:hypothetical protein
MTDHHLDHDTHHIRIDAMRHDDEFRRLEEIAWRIVSDLRSRRREPRNQSVRRVFVGPVPDAFEHVKNDDACQKRQGVSDHPSRDHQTYRAHLRSYQVNKN